MALSVYHIAHTGPTYPNKGWEQGFHQNFVKYHGVDWQTYRRLWGDKALRNKVLLEVEDIRPDFVFMQIQRPDIFDREFIAELQITCPVVNYNEDVREDIKWMADLNCALTLMSNMDDVLALRRMGLNADFMMPTYDECFYGTKNKNPFDQFAWGDIVFIGNSYASTNLTFPNAAERDEMVEAMEKAFPTQFRAYGRGYKNGYVQPAKEAACYRNSKIAVMHNNFTRKDYHSDRAIRALACGTVIVPHYTEITSIETSVLFANGWRTIEELIKRCKVLLEDQFFYNAVREMQQRDAVYQTPLHRVGNLIFILKEYNII
jgi:hypothetical protein